MVGISSSLKHDGEGQNIAFKHIGKVDLTC